MISIQKEFFFLLLRVKVVAVVVVVVVVVAFADVVVVVKVSQGELQKIIFLKKLLSSRFCFPLINTS